MKLLVLLALFGVFYINCLFASPKRKVIIIPPGNKLPFLGSVKTCECGTSPVSRIIMGVTATKLKYPWMTALCVNSPCGFKNQFCGGSIINDRYVLTASHCVVAGKAENITVSVGDWDLNTTSEVMSVERQVVQIILHEKYDDAKIKFDIALLKLATPVEFTDHIRPICLPPPGQTNLTRVLATIMGWGQLDPAKPLYPLKLKETDVRIISSSQCSSQYRPYVIESYMICATEPGKDSCFGDSGGPMVIKDSFGKYQQIGIVSFGQGCANVKAAGVYTRVSNFLDWIASKTTDAVKCS